MNIHRFALFSLAVGCLFVLSVLGAIPVAAEGPLVWTPAQPVAEDLDTSWFPEIAADPGGTFWMVWSGNLTDENANETGAINGAIMISKKTPEGWTPAVDLYVMSGGTASRPMLAIDDTFIHLIFRTDTHGQGEKHFYMRAALAADPTNLHSWSEPIAIAGGQSYWSDIATLPDHTLLVSYNQRITSTLDSDAEQQTALYTRRSRNQGTTWEAPVRVSPPGDRVARNSLAVSPADGTVTLVWDVGYDNMSGKGEPAGIFSAVSTDSGASWEDVQRIDAPEAKVASEAAAGTVVQSMVASNGTLTMLVYRSTAHDMLLYRTSADGGRTWQPEVAIEDVVARPYLTDHQFDKYGLAADSAGNFILTYIGTNPDAPDGLSAMSVIYEDEAWSSPTIIGGLIGFPEYAQIAVALGNQVQLVYFVRDQQFQDLGHYVLWVTSTTTDAPASQPQPIKPDPDPAPMPTAAPVVQLEIQVEPVPTPLPPTDPVPIRDAPRQPQSVISRPIGETLIITGLALVAVLLALTATRFARQHHI